MIHFLMAVHNHQPVGNFDHVFKNAVEKGYRPFLDVLKQHPKIKISLHFSGVLLEWLEEHDPEFLCIIKTLTEWGQLELLTGGFYEPILPVIPERDKRGQIEKQNDFIKKNFRVVPKGMWLAERVWEPHLAMPLNETGVKYVILDGTHFKLAGLVRDQLYGYYLTEEEGKTLALFPINDDLRDMIPFQTVDKVMDWIYRHGNDERAIIFGDDGEKFGVWPGTFHSVYEERWLENLFSRIEADSNIRMWHFSEYLERKKPAGRVYLPTSSYPEMLEWSQPAGTIEKFEDVRDKLKLCNLTPDEMQFVKSGGFWRNFLIKYPESNQMHKRMLRVSKRIEKMEKKYNKMSEYKEAQNLLWQSQCNCPYWHGVFGGLYLTHLRFAIYNRLIKADTLLDSIEHKGQWINVEDTDFNCDGFNEVVVETKFGFSCFLPQQGGGLFEYDLKKYGINVNDTITRKREAYHRRIAKAGAPATVALHDPMGVKEDGLVNYLIYDWHRRGSFIEHLLSHNTTLESFRRNTYKDMGDFALEAYEYEIDKKKTNAFVKMSRRGTVENSGRRMPLKIEKVMKFSAAKDIIEAEYTIANLSGEAVDLWFGIEFQFNLLAGDADDRYYTSDEKSVEPRNIGSSGELSGIRRLSLHDHWLGLKLSLSSEKPANYWRCPLETVSQSEGGYERIYQSSTVLPNWRIRIDGNGKWTNTLHVEAEKLG